MAIELKPLQRVHVEVTIIGETQLVTNKWAEKALQELRDKRTGAAKKKLRENKDPEEVARNATHFLSDGSYGFPANGIKAAVIAVAHKDIGITKVNIKQGLFIHADDPATNLVRINTKSPPKTREDLVRVSNGAPDIRWRPEFEAGWTIDLRCELDPEKLTPEILVNLLERAGFGVGLGEWRPHGKVGSGEWGRFRVLTEE